jgi:uncharacterized repeat protein (TIGR01451 family)
MEARALIVTALVALAPAAWAQSPDDVLPEAADVHLAPAPWMDPDAPETPADPILVPKAVQLVPPLDTMDIGAVIAAYNTYYNVPMPALGFTGSTASCNPGSISLAFQEWTISRINFLRAMAGVPAATTLNSSLDAQQQAAALIMAANNTLTHAPASNMLCYTSAGATGAAQSNLALGSTDSLPLYMSEPGNGNQPVGHRRWILHSRKTSFGMGQANNANALHTFQNGPVVAVPNGIPWPPRGYVPLALFPTQFTTTQRWSFGLPGANFSAAVVTVTRNGAPVTTNVVSRTDNGYGDNTIVWEMPSGHAVTAGSTYNVTVAGVTGTAQATYSYQVMPFDPSATSTDLAVTQAAPAAGATGRDVPFTLTVRNSGTGAASSVVLTNTVPAGASAIWASPGCTQSGNTFTCALGTLAAGASRQVQVVMRRATAGTLVSNASVTGSPADSNTANNSSSASVAVALSPAGVPVARYRLYSPVTLEHHFTTDLNEYNVLGAAVGTWIQEGTVGRVLNNPGSFGGVTAIPYYRLYDNGTRWHHWTTDANEYYTLGTFPGWVQEGVDGFILPTRAPGSIELYRLNYPALGSLHHWTVDANEYTTLIGQFGWVGEGGSGFVVP